ncbi:hypothetical protein GO491_11710 [Flavobacteriaceae bacterium Ap0902]|nr:hypothetical protein [Flavobacteriaceae bacterium Ap0902]
MKQDLYRPIEESKKLNAGQIVICRCPEWNHEGYQVAEWNGSEFEYSGQPNDKFNDLVIAFTPIDKDGIPYPSYYTGCFKKEFR